MLHFYDHRLVGLGPTGVTLLDVVILPVDGFLLGLGGPGCSGRLPEDPPELPPGDDISDHAGHVQDVHILVRHLEHHRAVLAESLK